MKELFRSIVKSKDLRAISKDMVEQVLDHEITDEALKEIPFVKSLVAVRNIYNSYTDRIFLKKAMYVLLELGVTTPKEREQLINALEDDDESGAEKILMAIDHMETIKKCKVYGRLCKIKAEERILTEDFLRLTKLLQDAYLDDLILITDFEEDDKMEIHEGDYFSILSLGLIYQEPSEQMPIERNFQYDEYDPEFKGGEIKFNYRLSDLGEDITSAL